MKFEIWNPHPMPPTPLISVIVACYNGASFLETSVRSAIENHPATEVIVVDDGSEDDSLATAAALSRQFPGRMLVASQSNQGPAGARNTGIRLARGRFLCFLDVDDQHLPGFLHAAVDVLERDPSAVAVACQIELINAHRPVETWQREAMEMSGPCNLVMRTEIVRQIGGFPVDAAFRGKAGGEDACFRKVLLKFGNVPKLEHPFFRYRMRPGGYVDLFLDRGSLIDGQVHLKYFTKEEEDGSIREATARYEREVTTRALSRLTESLQTSITATESFYGSAAALQSIPGTLHPIECHALHWLARTWPLDGGIVDIGATDARSIASLALGNREARRESIVALELPESSRPQVLAALDRATLSSAVQLRTESSDQAAASWTGRVRILSISANHDPSQLTAILTAWSPRLTRFGLVIFQGARSAPATAALIATLREDTSKWKELPRVQDLAILQKL